MVTENHGEVTEAHSEITLRISVKRMDAPAGTQAGAGGARANGVGKA